MTVFCFFTFIPLRLIYKFIVMALYIYAIQHFIKSKTL